MDVNSTPGSVALALMAMVCAFAVPAAAGADQAVPRRNPADVVRTLPETRTSSDGLITVVAASVPGDEMGFCGPLLQFAGGIVQSMGKALSLPPPARRRDAGIVIVAQDGRTNDVRVVSKAMPRKIGRQTRIWLPSPGHSDISLLRFEIARAYIRSQVDAHREHPVPPGTPPPAEMPDWLVAGILRICDIEQARADLRRVLSGWSSGYFPYFPSLCAQDDVPDVLAGYLAGWMREKALFPVVLKELAAGKAWDGRLLATRLTGCEDAAMQDRASDLRLVRMLRKVISPGRTAPADLHIFASRLLLYPSFYDKMFGDSHFGCTFRDAVALAANEPEIRIAAARKAQEVPLYALGRGEELQQASLAYRDFLLALSGGESPVRLTALLEGAETKFELAAESIRNRRREEGR
ncbi:MAG: hypothetical protein IKO72_13150 [Kiritimatiellae bacterium]|nr:hypothetical protein [Kiritimatiellia bacterium]